MKEHLPRRTVRICFVSLQGYHFLNSSHRHLTGIGSRAFASIVSAIGTACTPSMVTGDFGQQGIEKQGRITIFPSVRMVRRNGISNAYRFIRALRKADADIYVTSIFGKDIFITWLFCKLGKKKFVYRTAHDYECNRQEIQKHLLWGKLFQYALEHADLVVASVHQHIGMLRRHHPNIVSPIIHIPLGIEQPPQQEEEKKYTLWIARCHPIKNPLKFVELAKNMPAEQFVIIAAPQRGYETLLKKVERACSHVKNIRFIPGVPSYETQTYINKAKALVNTSDAEGFSFVFVESGLGKTPILSLHVNPDEVITKHSIGCFAHGSMQTLQQQLHALLYDRNDWKRKSENIFQYVQKNHNITTVVKAWEQALLSI